MICDCYQFHIGFQAPGMLGTYPCKQCKLEVPSAGGTSGLWAHRDGSKQPSKTGKVGCKHRDAPIEAGCILTLTVFKQQNKATNNSQGQTWISTYAPVVLKFDNKVLNQMLGMWVIRTAQSWRRIKDPLLRALFRYANPNAHLLGRGWVVKFAHKAYMEMRAVVFSELKVSDYYIIFAKLFDKYWRC